MVTKVSTNALKGIIYTIQEQHAEKYDITHDVFWMLHDDFN